MDWNINDFIVKFPNMNNIIKCFCRPNTDDLFIIQKDYMGLLEILLLLFSVKSYYVNFPFALIDVSRIRLHVRAYYINCAYNVVYN